MTGAPATLTLMGLGALPASHRNFIGMVGMHGSLEANMCMHDCDVMLCVGARFDDRVTGRVDAFSPDSTKIHIDIDPSSINKNIPVDVPIVGDCAYVLEDLIKIWKARQARCDGRALADWWARIDEWRARKSFSYKPSDSVIKPQRALERLNKRLAGRDDVYVTTEVGQHQMWAAQFIGFEKPNRWMTSGGLGTMGYGLPAAMGVQVAHPEALVIDVAGEASILMNIQEMSTLAQYRLPVKAFILNNRWMGMVRQWQEFFFEGRYAESYMDSLPDFVKLAEAFGAVGPARDASRRTRRRDRRDDRRPRSGDRRHRGRPGRKRLSDDPRRRRAQSDHHESGRGGWRSTRRTGKRAWSSSSAPAAGRHASRGACRRGVPLPESGTTAVSSSTRTATIAVLVDNEPGVLARVIGLFSGRGYNIDSLTVSEVDAVNHTSRITVVTSGTEMVIGQIKAQLGRLVPVHRVSDLSLEGPHVERELALVKVASSGEKRVEALRIADIFRARAVDSTVGSFVFEITGSIDKITAFVDLMRPLGLVDVSRTGVVAISRGPEAI